MSDLAPIVVFAHSRLQHLEQTVEALLANPEACDSDLIIFSDGPRSELELSQIFAVRDFIAGIQGFKSVSVHESAENSGLSESIIQGVTNVLTSHDKVIVLEDDIVTSQSFLRFMNDGLSKFSDDHRIASIHGYVYPIKSTLPEAFCLLGADCWGWATWRRAWRGFQDDAQALTNELESRNLRRLFDFNGSYPFSKMLEAQAVGKVDSWAIRWNASVFLQGKLTVYPGKSLVRNIGNDGSGTHSGRTNAFDSGISHSPVSLEDVAVEDSVEGRMAFELFFRSLGWPGRIWRTMRRFLK